MTEKCYGKCLEQQDDQNYQLTPNEDCPFKCKGIKCANFKLCGKIQPEWLYDTNANKNICKTCDIFYYSKNYDWDGIFIFHENSECNFCGKNTLLIEIPTCSHRVCVEKCFSEYFLPSEDFILNPTYFGCPRCPNGCPKGNGIGDTGGCSCDEFDEIYEKWCEEENEGYTKMKALEEMFDRYNRDNLLKGICPLDGKKF